MIRKPENLSFDIQSKRLVLDPRSQEFFHDPYQAYAWLHANSPTFYWENYKLWCFGGFDAVNQLLRDKRFGRENRWGAPQKSSLERQHIIDFDRVESSSLLELEPPAHTRLRNLVNRAFVSRSVERLRPLIEKLAHQLVDSFPIGEAFDLLPAFATPIPLFVICELLGVPKEEANNLVNWSHAMCEMYVPNRACEAELRANLAAKEFGDFIKDHIKIHRQKDTDDLLKSLINIRDAGENLSEEELVSTCILLLNAGHEATVHQTGNAIKAILQNTNKPNSLFELPQTCSATIEEALRYDAPLHMFTRYAYEAVDFGNGVTVKEGDSIGLLLGMANHDPTVFEHPTDFNAQRLHQKNVSFGAGIHFCIGAPLARLELQTSLKVLFERLPNLKLAGTPSYRNSYHFHGLEKLMVTV